MKPDAWVTIIVRFIGLFLMLWSSVGLTGAVGGDQNLLGSMSSFGGQPDLVALLLKLLIGMVGSITQSILGMYLFFNGRWVVRRILKGVNWPGRTTCHKCGYELAGVEGGRCPECGAKRADVID